MAPLLQFFAIPFCQAFMLVASHQLRRSNQEHGPITMTRCFAQIMLLNQCLRRCHGPGGTKRFTVCTSSQAHVLQDQNGILTRSQHAMCFMKCLSVRVLSLRHLTNSGSTKERGKCVPTTALPVPQGRRGFSIHQSVPMAPMVVQAQRAQLSSRRFVGANYTIKPFMTCNESMP